MRRDINGFIDATKWGRLLRELWRRADEDNVFSSAAALAFYLTLSLFPGLVFLLATLPYLPVPRLEQAVVEFGQQVLPATAAGLVTTTTRQVLQARGGGFVSLSLLGALWAASTGMFGLMRQLNITYRAAESRSFIRARAVAALLTLLFGVLIVATFAIIVFGGILQDWVAGALGWSAPLVFAFAALRWVVIVAALVVGFGTMYSLAPNVDQPFEPVSPGSVLGAAVLLLGSMGFRLYVENFGNYDAIYGGVGAVIVLMLWLYLSGFAVLLGSELNMALRGRRSEEKRRASDAR